MGFDIRLKPNTAGDDFKKLAKEFPHKIIEIALKKVSTQIKDKLQAGTPVGIGKTSGNLKRGWSDIKKRKGGFSFQNKVAYAEFLELGLYTGTGPRTSEGTRKGEFGIFSRQALGGIMQPLVENKEFVDGIVDGVATEMVRALKKGLGAR